VENRLLCSECVGEVFLRAEIVRNGRDGVCFYCETEGRTFTIGEMADQIEIAFEEHYYRTAEQASYMEYLMSKDEDIGYDWEREGDTVGSLIGWSAELEEEPAEDIRLVLAKRHYDYEAAQMGDENPFAEEAHYAGREIDDSESQAGWVHFEESLMTEARYFNPTVEATLTSTFEGIADHRTQDDRPIVAEVGPGREITTFYRARVFQSEERLVEALKRPDREVGPPPPSAATNGRMNPHGVAVFYGATDPLVSLAEVRPPVGSRVIIGRFEVIRPLQLLDIEALRSVNVEGSIFDRSYLHRKARAKFLDWLSRRITQPVMPDDEPFEYLPTQVIADFLATRTDPPLDGVLYSSVQGGEDKRNVVLFHKASRVENPSIPKDTEISVSVADQVEDGPQIHYWVSEEVPPTPLPETVTSNSTNINDPLFLQFVNAPFEENYDAREPALRLDVSSVEVRHVSGVDFKTENSTVQRHRVEKPLP